MGVPALRHSARETLTGWGPETVHAAWGSSLRGGGRPRGYFRVEEFCRVPPYTGMNPSGASQNITEGWGLEGGVVKKNNHLRVSTEPDRWKVRKTPHSIKIR